MKRTQIYLPEDLYREIAHLAEKEGKPKAQIIRERLKANLASTRVGKAKNAGEALLELAELGKKFNIKGPKNLSVTIDKYLYEEYDFENHR